MDEAATEEKFNEVRDGFESKLKEVKGAMRAFASALASGSKAKKKVDAEMARRLKTATKAKGTVSTTAPKTLDKLFDKLAEAVKSSEGESINTATIDVAETLDGKACKALLCTAPDATVQFVKDQSYFTKAVGWQRKHSEQTSESLARKGHAKGTCYHMRRRPSPFTLDQIRTIQRRFAPDAIPRPCMLRAMLGGRWELADGNYQYRGTDGN